VKGPKGIAVAGSASLIALSLLLAPAAAQTQRGKAARPGLSLSPRSVGSFTPAVSDPRLAAALARRNSASSGDFRFTPASTDRNRAVRVAIRARSNAPADATRTLASAAPASSVSAIMPSSYNLGVSVGWRSFAVSGDVAQSNSGLIGSTRESAQAGISYRADRRITGRVQVGAERVEGAPRLVNEERAYSLDVGGAFSIARNIDVTGGVRYRVAEDRIAPIARDERRDSQAVYVGTAFRF
jgi:hypothetical protein